MLPCFAGYSYTPCRRLMVTGGAARAGCILITLDVLELPTGLDAQLAGGGSRQQLQDGAGGSPSDEVCGDGAGRSNGEGSSHSRSRSTADGTEDADVSNADVMKQVEVAAAQTLLPEKAQGLTTSAQLTKATPGAHLTQPEPLLAASSSSPLDPPGRTTAATCPPTNPSPQLLALQPLVAEIPFVYRTTYEALRDPSRDERNLPEPATIQLTASLLLPLGTDLSCVRGWQAEESPGALHGQGTDGMQRLTLAARCMETYVASTVLACTEAAPAETEGSPAPAGWVAVKAKVSV